MSVKNEIVTRENEMKRTTKMDILIDKATWSRSNLRSTRSFDALKNRKHREIQREER